jgi:hypothetical protein
MTDLDDARADHQVGLEEHQREETVLMAALVEALGEMPNIVKGGAANAGSYSYTYPTLADVLGAVRPVLSKHFLAVSQPVTTDVEAGTVSIRTRILHVAGGVYDGGRITMPLGPNAQATGSTISYARRYGLMAALSITGSDDDDDGQAANVQPAPAVKRESKPDPAGAQMRRIGALMDDAGINNAPEARREIVAGIIGRKIKTRAEMTGPERSKTIDALQAIVDGSAMLEIGDDGLWRIVAVDPEPEGGT